MQFVCLKLRLMSFFNGTIVTEKQGNVTDIFSKNCKMNRAFIHLNTLIVP